MRFDLDVRIGVWAINSFAGWFWWCEWRRWVVWDVRVVCMLLFSMVGLFGGWVYPGFGGKGWYGELGVGLGVVVGR